MQAASRLGIQKAGVETGTFFRTAGVYVLGHIGAVYARRFYVGTYPVPYQQISLNLRRTPALSSILHPELLRVYNLRLDVQKRREEPKESRSGLVKFQGGPTAASCTYDNITRN